MNGLCFRLTMDSGFFSVFFRLCSVYLDCKRSGIRLYVDSTEWNYGRWNRYFQTLHERPTFPLYPSITVKEVSTDPNRWAIGEYRQAVRELFRLTPLLRHEVRKVVERIGGPYTAIFVRRGDKIVAEASYIPMSTILKWVPHDESTVFFVQTDDYTVIEEMRALLPTHTIHHTVPPHKRGSYHSIQFRQSVATPWTLKSPEEAYQETTEMLVGLSVCLAATHCWTDDTSNVGRFLKLMDDRVHIYPEDYTVDESYRQNPAWNIRA